MNYPILQLKGKVIFLILDNILGIIKFQIMRIFLGKKLRIDGLVRFSRSATIKARTGANICIGNKCSISSNSIISATANAMVIIGRGTGINYNSVIVAREKIVIGNNVLIGPNVSVYDHNHIFNQNKEIKYSGYKTAPIVIEDNVWIGANTVILKGVKIGTGSVVAAGSVIDRDIPAKSIVKNNRDLLIDNIKFRCYS